MRKAMTIGRILSAAALVCLAALATSYGAAQEDKPVRQVYQAQAMGQGTQLGKTFNVTINIEQFSAPDERTALLEAFQNSGSQGLYNALEKTHAKGRIGITGTLGYDISFARKIPNESGYKIRILTNRPISFGEAWYNGRSMDYNLSAIELDISNEKGKSGGILLPACQFTIDKKTNELVVENYQNPWKLQNVMDRTKE
jgi:hypothetical protein